MGYKIEQINQLKKLLAAQPKLRTNAVRLKTIDAVRLLKSDIDRMQRKGYGLDAIASILAQSGLRMNGKTLRNYLAKIRLDQPHATANMSLMVNHAEMHHELNVTPAAPPLSTPITPCFRAAKPASTDTHGTKGFALHPDTKDL